MKTFSIYKQVFILTKWSYSDMWTINTFQDTVKFRQLIVFMHNVDFSALSEESSIQLSSCELMMQDTSPIFRETVIDISLTSLGNRPKCWKTKTEKIKLLVKRKISEPPWPETKHLQLYFSSLVFLNHI